MKAWSLTRREEPAALEGNPGRRKLKQQKCSPVRISFLLTHSGNSVVTQKLSALEKIMSPAQQ